MTTFFLYANAHNTNVLGLVFGTGNPERPLLTKSCVLSECSKRIIHSFIELGDFFADGLSHALVRSREV